MEQTFTFPDSGITVRIRRVGPRTLEQIARRVTREFEREMPRPQPPMVRVVIGEEGDEVLEPNVSDPGYRERLKVWDSNLQIRQASAILRFLIDYAIVADIDPEAVRTLREALSPEDLMTEDGKPYTDHQVYVEHVCLSSNRDIEAVIQAILGLSQPRPERVNEEVARFQPYGKRETVEA